MQPCNAQRGIAGGRRGGVSARSWPKAGQRRTERVVMPDAGGTTVKDTRALEPPGAWLAAGVTLALLSVSYGSPLVLIVGLKPITDDLGTIRQVTSLAAALTWIGTGAGGILMGWVAARIGLRRTVVLGAVMIAAGLAISTLGSVWALFLGHFLFLGLLGNGAMF